MSKLWNIILLIANIVVLHCLFSGKTPALVTAGCWGRRQQVKTSSLLSVHSEANFSVSPNCCTSNYFHFQPGVQNITLWPLFIFIYLTNQWMWPSAHNHKQHLGNDKYSCPSLGLSFCWAKNDQKLGEWEMSVNGDWPWWLDGALGPWCNVSRNTRCRKSTVDQDYLPSC